MTLFAGCYTDPDFPLEPRGRGVSTLEFDVDTGRLSLVAETPCPPNPSYLAVSGDGRFLYACHEVQLPPPTPEGRISAHRLTPRGLELVDVVDSGGYAPCHVELEPEGRSLLVSHYGSGTVVRSAVEEGALGAVQSVGPSDGQRAHMAVVGPGGRFVYAVDLGADRVSVGLRQPPTGAPLAWRAVQTAAGAGPRHLVFSASGAVAYLVCERNGTVEAFSVDRETGDLTPFQRISTLPEGDTRPAGCGAIRLSPSGGHLVVSNRLGVDTLTVFTVDPNTGRLSRPSWVASGGSGPRDFVFDPTGRFVLVANMLSGNVAVFRFDPASGALTPVGPCPVPAVTCLTFCPEAPAPETERRLPTRGLHTPLR